MAREVESEEDPQSSELRQRVDELERQLERQQELIARHEAMLRRRKRFSDREAQRGTPCADCDEGILERKGHRLVCTSCDYVRHL